MEAETTLDLTIFHRFSAPNKNGEKHPVDTLDDAIAESIIALFHIFVLNGKLYLYGDGYFHIDEDGVLFKSMISKYIYPELRTEPRISRIYKLLLTTKMEIVIDESELNKHPPTWINFRNGMLDLRDLTLHPHDPGYHSINQIPHKWRPDHSPSDSVVADFLEGIIPDSEDRQMFLEYAGYCLTTDMHLQKFLIVCGEGGLGKSVLLRLMQWAVGRENFSCLTLQNLNDRFSPVSLFGKLMNIYADLPSTDMGEIAGIKTIVGQDVVRGEYKGGKTFGFQPYCKLLYSANQIPKSRDDKTSAYYRRLLILKIGQRADYIQELESRLRDHIDDFVHLIVMAVHNMYAMRSGALQESENSKQAVLELYMSTDTVKAFLVDSAIGRVPGGRMERSVLYRQYENYCDDEGREVGKLTTNGFYSNLREKGFNVCTIHGKRYFMDIGVTDFVEDKSEEEIPF